MAIEDSRQLNIPIEYCSIMYDAIESFENRMHEVLSPNPEGENVGSAIIQGVKKAKFYVKADLNPFTISSQMCTP